jgi:uncharacterized SAM-binding protein YcdF (DUF218 family)
VNRATRPLPDTAPLPDAVASGRGVRLAPESPPAAPERRWRRPFRAEARRWLLVLLLFVLVAPLLLGASLLGAIYWQARSDQTRPVDAIVVLGAAQYDGNPSPVLRARLDQAIAAYRAGNAPYIVVTGGRQPGDRFTEAQASRLYLIDQGIPERAILIESVGRTSWQSLQGVNRLMEAHGLHRVLLVSDGFHLLRVKLMARDLGLTAYGAPAKQSPIRPGSRTEFDYAVREAAGIVAHLLGKD